MDLERAVTATVAYASYFSFPLFPEEIYQWLVCSRPVSFKKLKPFLPKPLSVSDQRLRYKTNHYTEVKINHALKLVSILKYLPGIRLIALTGSVAATNAKKNDDIDLLFVTAPQTLWLLRPIVIGIISVLFHRRHPQEDHSHSPDAFCPNLWLETCSLVIDKANHSLYTAHEVLQILPLFDRGDAYQSFLKANRWTEKFLANAYNILVSVGTQAVTKRRGKSSLLVILANAGIHLFSLFLFLVLFPLNLLFFLLQYLYMYPKKTTEIVDLHRAFLHTTDFSSKLDYYLKVK